jgi:hypothetical protein
MEVQAFNTPLFWEAVSERNGRTSSCCECHHPLFAMAAQKATHRQLRSTFSLVLKSLDVLTTVHRRLLCAIYATSQGNVAASPNNSNGGSQSRADEAILATCTQPLPDQIPSRGNQGAHHHALGICRCFGGRGLIRQLLCSRLGGASTTSEPESVRRFRVFGGNRQQDACS